ncbi:MAG: DUF2683 family protein [Bacteroidota bacterium]
METLIMHPKNKEQLVALKALAKAWKISVETKESSYDPEFVEMIKTAEKRGNYKEINPKELNSQTYKQKLIQVSTWSDDDIKNIEQGKSAFENLKASQW